MPITRREAQRLLDSGEMELFDASRRQTICRHDARSLTALLRRARSARDKQRDLYQRQRLASQARTGDKGGRSGDANRRTLAKAELLDDILQRFDARLVRLADADAPSEAAGAKARAQRAHARAGREPRQTSSR
ncbi:hypothetical protein [Coralloluteibacterium thermophilus]|uniref:Uncharacterized protein n=1 Tax=Coralloluteibacterium thermophilum TaxID=2707049 RepID=A0ABV9NMG1_9GAMM